MNRRSRFVMQRSLPVSEEEEEPGGERYERFANPLAAPQPLIETHQRNRTVDVRLGEESPAVPRLVCLVRAEFLLPGFG
jgi:hypothetical protein